MLTANVFRSHTQRTDGKKKNHTTVCKKQNEKNMQLNHILSLYDGEYVYSNIQDCYKMINDT